MPEKLVASEKVHFIRRILPHSRKIGLLSYFAGLIWFSILSFNDFNHRTYISENALLPGLADEFFNMDGSINTIYKKLEKFHQNGDDRGLQQLILSELKSYDIDVGQQNFTLDFPDLLGDQKVSGMNTYGILRSPGTARTEALLFSVPLRTKDNQEKATIGGVAMTLMLTSFLRRVPHIAKDVVIVFTEMEFVGMQAFLDAYHGTQKSQFIKFADLEHRSGSIQAGLSFEIAGPKINYLEAKIEGLNGILPNLDLLNMVIVLANKHGLSLRFQGKREPMYYEMTPKDMKHSLYTMTSLMRNLATGSPSGLHGLMLAFQIPAITLAAPNTRSGDTVDLATGTRMLEGIFRSLNSLQERFHQSFFFYLLPKLNRYVSIGVYTPPYVAIYIGVLLHLLDLWMKIKDESSAGDNKPGSMSIELWQVLPVGIVAAVFGFCTYAGGPFFLRIGRPFGVEAGSAMLTGLAAVFTGALVTPYMIKRKNQKLFCDNGLFLKCFACLVLCLLLGCLGILNISLATGLAIPLVPAILLLSPSISSRSLRLLNALLLLAVSPISLIAMASHLDRLVFGLNSASSPILVRIQRALIQSWVEQELLGSWTYGIVALIVFPIWIVLWAVVWSGGQEQLLLSPPTVAIAADEGTSADQVSDKKKKKKKT